jgi:hypothetical protein
MEIRSQKLATCGVTADGETINLDLFDTDGTRISLNLPFEQAGALAMALPHLLTVAVRVRTGDDAARFVFTLGEWRVECADDQRTMIVTLKTDDGFEASFGMPVDICRSLAGALKLDARYIADRVKQTFN